MAHIPSLSGLSLNDAPAPTATDPDDYPDPNSIVYEPVRAEQIDGTVKSEEQILSELYEFFLEQEKDRLTNGIVYAKTIPARYPPGGYLEFDGARILGDVWVRLRREAEADARELLDLGRLARDTTAKRKHSAGPSVRKRDEEYDPDAHSAAIYAEAKQLYDSMNARERWEWTQSVGNVSVSPQREWELEQIKELFEEWGVHDPADDDEEAVSPRVA